MLGGKLFYKDIRNTKEIMKMRCNKRKMLYVRRVLMVGALIGGFIIITNSLNYLLAQPDEWSRFMLYHFYNREEPIDNVWIGSSHVYRDVNPEIMDELSGEKNFNLSTGSQSFSQSLLLLQEAVQKYDIKHVYLEMYYYVHVKGSGNSYKVDRHFRVWDYVNNSLKKQMAIIEQQPEEELFATYMPFVRFNKYIYDSNYIKEQNKVKKSEVYQHYEYYVNGDLLRYKNGYLERDTIWEEKNFRKEKAVFIEENPLLEEAEKYLTDIIEYCAENEIELTLFSSPISELEMLSIGDYDNYVNQINEIAAAYDLEYYDFNLCKEEYLPIQELKYFSDDDHLNADGAELFTPVLYDVVTNDRKDYFYNSYKEKLEKTAPAVYGLLTDGENENCEVKYEIASNKECGIEYRIEFIPEERMVKCEVIQDYSENKEFAYRNEAAGSFLISARMAGEEETFTELTINK